MSKAAADKINMIMDAFRTDGREALVSEPAYYVRTSTRAQRRLCREGLPLADCNFFHDCLREV